jgi:hypothetical protein
MMYAKRRVVAWRVVARFKSKEWLKSQATGRHRAVWRPSLETVRQDDDTTTRRFALCRVVASDKTKTI